MISFHSGPSLLLSLHSRVPRAIQFYVRENPVCVALEYCSNGDLKEFVRKKGRSLSDGERTSIAMQIASGMAVIHGAGIAHLDLKVGVGWLVGLWRALVCVQISTQARVRSSPSLDTNTTDCQHSGGFEQAHEDCRLWHQPPGGRRRTCDGQRRDHGQRDGYHDRVGWQRRQRWSCHRLWRRARVGAKMDAWWVLVGCDCL